jgi:hypothetical protein
MSQLSSREVRMPKRVGAIALAAFVLASAGAVVTAARAQVDPAHNNRTELRQQKSTLKHQRQKAKRLVKRLRQKAKRSVKRQQAKARRPLTDALPGRFKTAAAREFSWIA